MAGTVTFALIGAPSSAGAHHAGLERTPAALRARGLVERLRAAGVDLVDTGDRPTREFAPDHDHPTARGAEGVVGVLRDIAAAVARARGQGLVPLVVGGDCTVTLGVTAAVAATSAAPGLLYLDGDADLATPATTSSGILDAMVIAHLIGEADSPVTAALADLRSGGPGPTAADDAVNGGPVIGDERIAMLGYNPDDPDSFDATVLARHPELFHEPGPRLAHRPVAVARAARDRVEATADAVVVHFDVDAVDSADLPLADFPHYGVGVPLATAQVVFTELLATPTLAAVVLTEVNTTYDASGRELDRYLAAVCAALGAGAPSAG